jgi:hypothetical protein
MQIILFTDISDTPGYGKYAGTYKLSTEIRKNGYTCQVIDNYTSYSLARLKLIVDKFVSKDTILVGFSCTLNEKRKDGTVLHWGMPSKDIISLVEYIKEKNHKVQTVAGGSRITSHSDWPYIDFTVINKADIAIIKLIKHIQDNDQLIFKQKKYSKLINGDDYFYSQDLFNDSQIIFEDNDIILSNESLPMEIARGCIFKCAYCHFDLIGKKIGDWTKNPETIKDEIIRNYEMFGTTHYMFSDELINESISKMEMVANVVASLPFKIRYTSYARIDLIHKYPEMRELLLESGAASLAFGIETFNLEAGRSVGKGMHPEKTKEILSYCAEKWRGRIITSSNFIVGLPGETEEDIWRTVEYLVGEDCPLDVFGFLPLYIRNQSDGRAASKMDADPQKFGYILEEGKWTSSTMSFERASKLVKEIYSTDVVKQRAKFAAATWIGRILSLGYSVEKIYSMIYDSENYESEISERTKEMKEVYFQKLMSL